MTDLNFVATFLPSVAVAARYFYRKVNDVAWVESTSMYVATPYLHDMRLRRWNRRDAGKVIWEWRQVDTKGKDHDRHK